MTRSEKLAIRLLKPINTSAILLLGGYTILWGAWVGSPFWSVFAQSPLYMQLASLMPEWAWGVAAVVVGSVTVYGVLKPAYRSLLTGAAVVGWYWGIVALLYFWGDWQSTGGITAMAFATYSAFIYLNIKVNKNRLHLDLDAATQRLRDKNY